jgi:hypothetical protein
VLEIITCVVRRVAEAHPAPTPLRRCDAATLRFSPHCDDPCWMPTVPRMQGADAWAKTKQGTSSKHDGAKFAKDLDALASATLVGDEATLKSLSVGVRSRIELGFASMRNGAISFLPQTASAALVETVRKELQEYVHEEVERLDTRIDEETATREVRRYTPLPAS